jgi:hypothetical protein
MSSYTALIDGDIVLYRCGFAAEHTHYVVFDKDGDPDVPVAHLDSAAALRAWQEEQAIVSKTEPHYRIEREREVEPLSHALANIKSVMAGILEATRVADFKLFISGGECFRHRIATMKEYKGNRKDTPKPVHLDAMREFLEERYGAEQCIDIEADDALAMAMNERTVLCSIDKDLLQVPGYHYNWVLDQKILIEPDVGLRKLYLQVITGDSTDNIPGVRGIGPVKARKLLESVPPDKDALMESCIKAWDAYLNSDAPKPMENLKDAPGLGWMYTHWNGEEDVIKTSTEIAEEVLSLVTVGEQDAIKEKQQTSDTLHDSAGAEGEEPQAAGAV